MSGVVCGGNCAVSGVAAGAGQECRRVADGFGFLEIVSSRGSSCESLGGRGGEAEEPCLCDVLILRYASDLVRLACNQSDRSV